MIRLFYSREFLLFLTCGGIAAVVNFISRIILNVWLNFSISVVIAYVLGMIVAFTLNKRLVFTAAAQAMGKSVFYFSLVNAIGLTQTWFISMGLNYYVFPYFGYEYYSRELAHGVGIMVPAFSSYIGHKYLSFK